MRALFALSLLGLSAPALANDTVVPAAFEDVDSGTKNRFPFGIDSGNEVVPWYQQAYDAAELTALVGRPITGVAVRVAGLDGDVAGGAVYNGFEVRLSTGTNLVDNLSTDMSANLGADVLVVLTGTFVLPNLEGDASPNPFDLLVEFDTPFPYAGGDLLLDIRHTSTDSTPFFLDVANLADSVSRAYERDGSTFTDSGGLVTQLCSDGPVGSSYCGPANLNSAGLSAEISGSGSDVVDQNDLELIAALLPANKFGYFLVSETQDFVANPGGSQGNLCLGGTIGRYAKQVQNSGSGGTFSMVADLTALPFSPPKRVLAGETWNFQAWYRDNNPDPTSNFTDGLTITFQ